MEDVRVFIKFLKLVQKNFKGERNIEFYAGELGVSSEELSRIIMETTNSTPDEWLEIMEKTNSENRSYQEIL